MSHTASIAQSQAPPGRHHEAAMQPHFLQPPTSAYHPQQATGVIQDYPPPWSVTVAARKGPLPSLIFALPFPECPPGMRKTKHTPLFLLYSLPRAKYEKPKRLPDGHKEKEGLIKKCERKWQEEVEEGQNIKLGKKSANRFLKWLPDNSIETLGRLPPSKKIGLITVIYPHEADEYYNGVIQREPEEYQQGLDQILLRTQKQAFLKTTLSGLMLPLTAAIDIFCIVPLFVFEINIAYFVLQLNGARKVSTLSKMRTAYGVKPKKKGIKARFHPRAPQQEPEPQTSSPPLPDEPTEFAPVDIFNVQKSRPNVFRPALEHLYNLCSSIKPKAFPPRTDLSSSASQQPDRAVAISLIEGFKEWVPADVAMRHNLDPDLVARDLGRCMKKATKEYVGTLKKIKTKGCV